MTRDHEAILDLVSQAVADGDVVDWTRLDVGDAQSRKVVEGLRVLAEVARLHRDTIDDQAGRDAHRPPPLEPGETWGHLTLRGVLGHGARGYVYRAWDPQLDRDVALKLTADREDDRSGLDIIEEARLLARVTHPHVATIYGAERRGGLVGLWMELVEGETLETMLLRAGRFSAREAANIGLDVCSALSAVHKAGLLHRDIKGQNVMRDRNGRIVVMDFGTSRDAVPSAGEFVHDEVGTPLYMAPELFAGAKASVQSDLYSVGVLLFRLVTGTVPVEAHSPRDLKEAHEAGRRLRLADVRAGLPLSFVRVVERALSPDPAARHASAGELEMALAGVLAPAEPASRSRRGWAWPVVAAAAAAGLLVGSIAVGVWSSRTPPPAEVRFSVFSQPGQEIESLAISPDGLRLAYTSAGRLHVRRMSDVTAAEIPQTQGARDPFWSPDGQWVAFFKGVSLWKVRAAGGEPELVAAARRPSSGSWGPDGSLLYSIEHGTSLVRVPSTGGTPAPLRVQQAGVRTSLAWPSFIGDGSHFLYSAVSGRTGRRMVYLGRTSDGPDAADRELLEVDSNPVVVDHWLFYTHRQQLLVRRVDTRAGRLVGDVVKIADGIHTDPYGLGAAELAAAAPRGTGSRARGTVAFIAAQASPRTLQIVDGDGRVRESFGNLDIRDMQLSPDGTRLAYELVEPETHTRDIWVLDLARRAHVRLSQDEGEDLAPLWSPDGRTVYFLSRRDMRYALYAAPANGGARELELFRFDGPVMPHRLTSDGRSVIYEQQDQKSGWDLWSRPLDGGPPVSLVRSSSNDQDAAPSPDGRFLAYSSPESGGRQVWLVPMPADGRRWRVSSDYGREPIWSPDGRTLYFHGLNKTLMRAEVDSRGATPIVGAPKGLFTIPFLGYDMRTHYAVLPEPDRFLVAAPVAAMPAVPATVVLNTPLP